MLKIFFDISFPGLLDSRKRTGKDLAYLLRHLKRFVAGTGMDLPGIFVILAEFLLNWDGLTFRTELFNLLPYLPIQLAKFEGKPLLIFFLLLW